MELIGMETGNWIGYAIGNGSLRCCRTLVYRLAVCYVPLGGDGCRSGCVCLKEGENDGKE